MTIPTTDIKMLWSRAAGRCSFEICRKELALSEDSSNTILGEMAHIIGEKRNSARGRHSLPLNKRNFYQNLMLLCPNHHTEIDKNEKKFTIEKLYRIKSDHEKWVVENLKVKELSDSDLFYSHTIDIITEQLRLNQWSWFIDHAVRDILHESYFDAREILNKIYLGGQFPYKYILLRYYTKKMIEAFSDYITNFENNSEGRDRGFHVQNKDYKRIFMNPNYHSDARLGEIWSQYNYLYLCKFVIYLNKFSYYVRRYINSRYFLLHGDFLIEDSMGYRNNLRNSLFKPDHKWIRKFSNYLKNKYDEKEIKLALQGDVR